MVLVLRDFIVITELLSFQICLILTSSLLLLIHSRPFLLLRLPYFIATVSLVRFLSFFFVGQKATDLHLSHLLFIIYYYKFSPDTTRNEIGFKKQFLCGEYKTRS